MGVFMPLPSTANNGNMKSSTEREVSRIIRLNDSFSLNLLGLYSGNSMISSPF